MPLSTPPSGDTPKSPAPESIACREFRGGFGWCKTEATVWVDNEPFCGHHGIQRQRCSEETRRRTGAA